jgi:microcystin-dependent protein
MDAFIGEIRSFAFDFPPEGWLPCYGQIVSARQYQALHALLGTTYGGSAQNQTFGLPNFQSMAMIGMGSGPSLTTRVMAKTYGTSTETLSSTAYLAPHNHSLNAMALATGSNVQANALAAPVAGSSWLSQLGLLKDATHYKYAKPYLPNSTVDTQFSALTIDPACGNSSGGVDPHNNFQPYLCMAMCICWNGIFPQYN